MSTNTATDGKQRLKLAVLTSGGDSAGVNAAVRTGYEGLVRGNSVPAPPVPAPARSTQAEQLADDAFLLRHGEGDAEEQLDGQTLKGRYIIRVGWDDGGTLIGTARSQRFRTPEGRLSAAFNFNMVKEGIEALVVCGGDGSLTGADVFRAERPSLMKQLYEKGAHAQFNRHSHLRIVGLVGSIDNDMSMTDLTIGALTGLHRICETIDINSTATSHSRAFVIEVMGRHCGWLALMAGISGGADFVFIPERPPRADPWEDDMCEVIQRHRAAGKRKTIVIVAEGAHDANMQRIGVDYVKTILREKLKLDTRVTTLGHTQRGGKPCAFDRILPMLQGVDAVNALLEATPETLSYMIGIQENKITRIPLVEAVKQACRPHEQAFAPLTFCRQKLWRIALRSRIMRRPCLCDPEFAEVLESFFTVSALDKTRLLPEDKRLRIGIIHVGAPAGGMNAATRTAGPLNDNVHPLSWLRVDSWMARGGSELGTNSTLPSIDIGNVAAKFQHHGFDAVFIVGGFEAFTSLVQLEQGRQHYPAFRIPMVHLPATISNNVPITEFSLGSHTALNALVNACDVLRQSASASRNRFFVVETQGGKCGYIATMGALAVGAVLVYTPEVRGTCSTNEQSSQIFTTDVIAKIIREEGGSLFDSRSASLGHILQGDVPSPLDRARCSRIVMTRVHEMEEHADIKNRRNLNSWWEGCKDLVELLGGRTALVNGKSQHK
ncbi:PFK-domain-containing protein [Auricularia subglabra TFB-10046 SS5]|nr:PFK-domain-containing protein [Auricularia subglabra TFB-10046 SS5]